MATFIIVSVVALLLSAIRPEELEDYFNNVEE